LQGSAIEKGIDLIGDGAIPRWVDPTVYSEIVAAEGNRIAVVARDGPLDARVPHMKRWRMQDVVAHLGGVHRWATQIVSTCSWDGSGFHRGRDEGESLILWFEQGVADLVAALEAADPAAKCPNFSPGSPQVAGFWSRRQAHETTVHRWDAESASGAITPILPLVATDGIDELLHTFTRTRGHQVLDEVLELLTTDTGAAWTVTPAAKPGRVEVVRGKPIGAAATVSGPAEDLLLSLWHRLSIEEASLAITGRTEAAVGFVTGPVTS
jgi:uncharacterized protein (TIGR03083 family)